MNPLVSKRKELGLTQTQLARMLGTKQSNLSAYERGVLETGSAVEQRFAVLLGLRTDSVYRYGVFPTLASQSVELRELLNQPRFAQRESRNSLIMRMLIDSNDRFVALDSLDEQQFFLMQPGPTGEHRADVALAGMAVHWSRKAKLDRVPAWTRNPQLHLKNAWFLGAGESEPLARAISIARGVPALRARGIFFAESNLASI
jgi:transcriptional regulator with XRE-family HTH domain